MNGSIAGRGLKVKRYIRDADLARLNNLRVYRHHVLDSKPKVRLLRRGRDYIFYKIVNTNRSPYMFTSPIKYTDGATVSIGRVNRDPNMDCGKGLHVLVGKPERSRHLSFAALRDPCQILIRVLVKENDIACVPVFGHLHGRPKLRVRKLTVLGQVAWGPTRRTAST